MRPFISIVIPAFNEELCIGKCLSSLKEQDYKGKYEIIVVDNNSSDRTAEIAQSFQVRVVVERRQGVCAARQAGTESTRGEIVVSTDADTVFDKSWLTIIANTFESNPRLVGVAGECVYVDAPWWGNPFFQFLFIFSQFIQRITGKLPYGVASNIAFKKDAWTGYDTNLTQGGDELYLLQSLQKRGQIRFSKESKVYTSSRRLKRGLLYNVWTTYFLGYFCEYIYGRFMGKSFLGSYEAIRDTNTPKQIALTFDDGPNEPYTTGLLDILRKHNAEATFFVVGKNIERSPETLRKILENGHVIGNHLYSHNFLNYLRSPTMRGEIKRTQELIMQTTNKKPGLLRTPWLFRQPLLTRAISREGLTYVSGHFAHEFEVFQPRADKIASRVLEKAAPGKIIIMHDGYDAKGGDRSQTVKAVDILIPKLRELGYSLVTVDKLLKVPAYQ